MKNIVLLSVIILITTILQAQTTETLVIKSSNKGLYVDHKVTPKENFYSMGRAFNVHPKHIAAFNGLDMSKGLSLGQTVKIPLSDTNFTQKTDKGVPIYYITGNGETLYRVSTNNKNVLMENLRKWNRLSSDKLPNGTKLVVGFLTTRETQAMAVNSPSQKTETTTKPAQENKDVAKTDVLTKPEQKKDEVKSSEVKSDIAARPDQKKKDVTQPKEEPKKNNDVVQVKEDVKVKNSDQGYFKTSFDRQVKQQPANKEQTVTSGIFKTASGWNDAKYYLLMNGAEAGTIIRITNPANNKIIYAKLLGEMNDKQSQGLNIRISNAAASALDISETDKFTVKLNY
ncbi:MAG TPA: LysM peptidoglycan-binding domain-containing protein [Chitinophagaceae bacterium]|nr:LysM peptidoglycan-binding domain-containing protein [Chitinophagaceae bacterium]